ncbi:nitroreductase family protein [Bacillus sp. P14.5]|uniref:nitroreductase family protein n=1 Tax=Bacillus sp. P14.5 TaxID=1983400 RepID=UPI0013B05532|nr:nitroreductase family protein [Bacillus sp. P14.5]
MTASKEKITLDYQRMSESAQHERLDHFLSRLNIRREVKSFSKQNIPIETIKNAIKAAGTSPSGANQQPWSFVLVSDPKVKTQIINEVRSKSTTLEEAPYMVVLLKQKYGRKITESGECHKVKHYYPNESVGICGGFFITALNQAGLHYNLHQPVKSLSEILDRPENEEPYMLFSIGIADEWEDKKHNIQQDLIHFDFVEEHVEYKSFDKYSQVSSPPLSAEDYYYSIKKRRNVRDFSQEEIPASLLAKAFQALYSSPFPDSYRFEIVSDEKIKALIREKAEEEEKKFYQEKITNEWRDVLKPLGTNWEKSHLTDAPYLIIGFKVMNDMVQDPLYPGKNRPIVSSAVNTGILMSAIHHANLCMLTHTPSPMVFLRDLLNRPKNEVPIVVIPAGYPADNCQVPDISKKPLEDIITTLTESEGEAS